ncbi:MAG: hypothetical protein LBD43_03630, partial [Holosporales bacterium]|nr:hypothetical protein [Holosporales bacterium]
ILTNVAGARDLYEPRITVDKNICPSEKSVADLMMGNCGTAESAKSNLHYHKCAAQTWSQIRMSRFQNG